MLKSIANRGERFFIGQVNDSEMSGILQVKAAAVCYEHLFLAKEVKSKLLVTCDIVHIRIKLGEYVECCVGLYYAHARNGCEAVVDVISLLVYSSTGHQEHICALYSAKSCLND